MIQSIRILVDLCICGHLEEDHELKCIVIEDGKSCLCTVFTPDDDEGYSFTDDKGRRLQGVA
jgi:hypothetical protein